jgi:tetratricopeptide (TPR) repeat protein
LKQSEEFFNRSAEAWEVVKPIAPGAYEDNITAPLNGLAEVYCHVGRTDDCYAKRLQVLNIYENLTKANPDVPQYRQNLSSQLEQVGGDFWKKQDLQKAEACFREAIEVLEALPDDENLTNQRRIANKIEWFQNFLSNSGRLDEAEKMETQLIAIFSKISKVDPTYQTLLEIHLQNRVKLQESRKPVLPSPVAPQN